MNKQKNTKFRKGIKVLLLLFCFVRMGSGMLSATTVEDKKWSIEFNNLPISDVFNKIMEVSGVEIVLNTEMDIKLITKSYKNCTIDKMLRDILQGESFAALFQYNEQELTSVDISILPRNASPSEISNINKLIRDKKAAVETKTRVVHAAEKAGENQYGGTIASEMRDSNKNSNNTAKNTIRFLSFNANASDSSNSVIDRIEDVTEYEVVDVPLAPEPDKFGGLEPPPMPPGIILFK